ncbi:TetR/AcrR family transcriptional regulator [Specibacter cremeus]|uniref:TetR/AcrR family transcriptional regulator n=1 Tax=Specibacter cremeus TaxID=1629051 RepID=UPI00197CB1D4|nr:TetR family transcriptional regulator [Specibacter cremeus]
MRREIQAQALQLFRDQGYDATTVEQVAAASLVSESTLYRHFPTKADLVLQDDMDPLIDAAFAAQPPELNAVEAIVGAMREVLGHVSGAEAAGMRERMNLLWTVPELRATALDQLVQGIEQVAALAAARTGRTVDDPQIRALAGAVVGAAMAALLSAVGDPGADLVGLVAEYLDHIEAALRL